MNQRSHGKVSTKPASELPDLFPFSKVATTLLLTVALLVALFLFYFFPDIDRAAAALFFDETACGSARPAGSVCGFFPVGEMAPMKALRQRGGVNWRSTSNSAGRSTTTRLRSGVRPRRGTSTTTRCPTASRSSAASGK